MVGESGCGKSVTALSIMRLIREPPGRIVAGQIIYNGRNLLDAPPTQMRKIRGKEISMIFQEPMTSLNPVFTCRRADRRGDPAAPGAQPPRRHGQALEMLQLVHIPNAERRVKEYPHQLSGGMRQRVMIAMALSCNPNLLIADEPTTALDVTIQAQILELLNELKAKLNMAIMLITHDMGVIAETAQRVVVMYGAQVVEEAPVGELFKAAAASLHPGAAALDPADRPGRDQAAEARADPGHRADAARRHRSRAAASRRAARSRKPHALRRNAAAERSPAGPQGGLLPAMTPVAEPLLAGPQPQEVLPDPRRPALARGRPRARGRRRVLRHPAGRDARPRWRIGLRQVDDGPRDPAPDRADLGRGLVPRQQRDDARQALAARISGRRCRSSSRTRTRRSIPG